MIRKKPAPDLIRGGCRLSEKIMLHQRSKSAMTINLKPSRSAADAKSAREPANATTGAFAEVVGQSSVGRLVTLSLLGWAMPSRALEWAPRLLLIGA
jgi:hypothetical protein